MTADPMLLYRAYKSVLTRRLHGRCRGKTRYPGIVEAARALGVNRSHIYRVLEGERRSPRVEAYFRKLARLTGGGR